MKSIHQPKLIMTEEKKMNKMRMKSNNQHAPDAKTFTEGRKVFAGFVIYFYFFKSALELKTGKVKQAW